MRPLPAPAVAAFSLLLAVIGVWLVIAPTAVGYQVAPAPWVDATWNDMIVGGILVLAGLGLLVAQMTSVVRSGRPA